MGNVSVRGGDGGNDPSEVEYEEGGQLQGSSMEEVGQSSPYVDYHALGGAPDLMGQSPPQSPRATQSPLMFTPQGPHSDFSGPTSGSMACVAVIRNNQLVLANAGDSRCVISRKGQGYVGSMMQGDDVQYGIIESL